MTTIITTRTAVAPVLTSGMNTQALAAIKATLPSRSLNNIGWVTPIRPVADLSPEVHETTLTSPQLINWISFDLAHYPQRVLIEAYVNGAWQNLTTTTEELIEVVVSTSNPTVVPAQPTIVNGSNPLHPLDATHWLHYELDLTAVTTNSVRVVITRNPDGDPPLTQISQITQGAQTVVPPARPAGATNILKSGNEMYVGDSLVSPNGYYTFELQYDGNLVIRDTGRPIWASNTAVTEVGSAKAGAHLAMQGDGNLVLYTSSNQPVWYTRTAGPNPILDMQDDGNLVVYRNAGIGGPTSAMWASRTTGFPVGALPTDPPGNNYGAIEMTSTVQANGAPYSLALANLQLAYKITTFADSDVAVTPEQAAAGITNPIITSYTDSVGGQVALRKNVRAAVNLINESGSIWMSRPQPAIDAVVCLYTDVRNADGTGVVLDRFEVDPVTTGVTVNLYYSNANPPNPTLDPGTSEFYEGMYWHPINRDYVLQKGYLDTPPTLAKFWKLEFTNLVAQPNYTYDAAGEPTVYKVHPGGSRPITTTPGYQPYDQATIPGLTTAQTSGSNTSVATTYTDARALPATTLAPGATSPVASLASLLASIRTLLRNISPIYGMVQVHANPTSPTRFTQPGVHVYQEVSTLQTETIGYYVGLNGLKAYRQDFTADDNTAEYIDHFHDLTNLAVSGFDWQPGLLFMDDSQLAAQAISNVFSSSREVTAVQFAATQSDPVQLLPDQDFTDPTQWWAAGDTTITYESAADSNLGNVVAVQRGSGLSGGLSTYPIPAINARLHAACRVYADDDLDGVLILQILNGSGHPIASQSVSVNGGQTVEWTCDVTPAVNSGPFIVQVFQSGLTNDLFYVNALSLFQDGLLWEFSADAGITWKPALDINANPRGVLVFDNIGTGLMYRVTALYAHQFVSSLSIRPWYAGLLSGILPRNGLVPGGPNLNLSDHYAPIEQDPAWQQWGKPVPRWWYLAGKINGGNS